MENGIHLDPAIGARNLLQACLQARPGDKLLVLSENPAEGFYDQRAPQAVVEQAIDMGLSVDRREVPFVAEAGEADQDIWDHMQRVDHIVFFARLGDQIRFDALPAVSKAAVVYAMDEGMLGSRFGAASHEGFVRLKDRINAAMAQASCIRMTCPLGTDISGRLSAAAAAESNDEGEVTIRRFPMAVFKPVPADKFSGRVVVSRFLTGTGHRYYTPYDLLLDGPVVAQVEAGRVRTYEGPSGEVEKVRAHVRRVAERFGIDPDVIHSWHAGIHPGCAYLPEARDNLARWGNAAFANPRIMHFHTCGDYAPGEISWNVIDPTIELDGIAVWDHGVLHPERIGGGAEVLDRWPDIRQVFDHPSQEIGL
jgi:hypothetical protein